MDFKVIPAGPFLKEYKKLLKRYPSLKEDVLLLAEQLVLNPESGQSLGSNLFKVRLSIKSKGKGKSGGARVITYLVKAEKDIFLISIYDKSDMDALPIAYLKEIAERVFKERKV
jgi:hypothetical protein